MIISYKTRNLRDNSLSDFLSYQNLPENANKRLRFILTALASGDTLKDVPKISHIKTVNDTLTLSLNNELVVHFTIAHQSPPMINEIFNWDLVSRLQLKYIGKDFNDK